MTASKVFRPITSPIARRVSSLPPFPLKYIGASLLLGFSTDQYMAGGLGSRPDPLLFSDLITFIRSSGGGRFNASGQYEWLPANQPRIDYDPVTGECRGLLVEEQRTNLLTNSVFAGATVGVLGAGGALPTGWALETAAGLVTEVIGTGTDAGFAYLDIRVSGTQNGSFYQLRTGTIATGAAGQVYAAQVRAKRLIGDLPAGLRLAVIEATGAFAGSSETVALSAAFQRVSTTRTVALSSAPLQMRVQHAGYSGAVDCTFRIATPQLEAGSFPSSYIPTTDAQVTRAAETPSVNTLSPWFNASEGTLFVEWVQPAVKVGQQNVFDLNDGTTSNRIAGLIESNSSIFQSRYASGGSILPNRSAPLAVPGTICRAALSYSDGAQEFAFNGAIFGTGAIAGTLGLVSAMRVGGGLGGSLNSHIRSIRFYPKALSDTELQAITQ